MVWIQNDHVRDFYWIRCWGGGGDGQWEKGRVIEGKLGVGSRIIIGVEGKP
jgi:hypothetical protein